MMTNQHINQPDHIAHVRNMVADTNQASEDELRQSLATLFYDDSYEYMLSRPDLFDVGAIDAAVDLIRTEKLKLLAEVRERVVGEDEDTQKWEDPIDRQVADECNQLRAEMRTILTKLEAEL